jgi:hypothetical protein
LLSFRLHRLCRVAGLSCSPLEFRVLVTKFCFGVSIQPGKKTAIVSVFSIRFGSFKTI